MTFTVHGIATWTAERGPLAAMRDAPDAMRTRFGRMSAHVLAVIDAASDPESPWIAATTHGPWHARVSTATAGRGEPWTTPDVVQQLSHAMAHRGPLAIVAAGASTTAMALVEAAAAIARHGRALVLFVEESTPVGSGAPLHDALAVAIRLHATPHEGPHVGIPQRRRDAAPMPVAAALANNPLAPALALARALEDGVVGWWPLQSAAARGEAIWSVELSA